MMILLRMIFAILLCVIFILPLLFVTVIGGLISQNEKLMEINDMLFSLVYKMCTFDIISPFEMREVENGAAI